MVKRISRTALFAAAALFSLVLVLAATGLSLEAICEWRDARRFPPPGRMVDVGGYRMHLLCKGEGSPTIVLASGAGVVMWGPVQEEMSKTTRTCSFDRTGIAWSDLSPHPRTIEWMADELHTLLVNGGVPGPYILAGHSFDGVMVRVFTQRYRSEVVGLVLVDSSHPNQLERWMTLPGLRKRIEGERRSRRFTWLEARLGLLRLVPSLGSPLIDRKEAQDKVSPEISTAAVALNLSPKYYIEVGNEGRMLSRNFAVGRTTGSLGDMPLVVVTAGIRPIPLDASPELQSALVQAGQIWQYEYQVDLMHLSSKGKRIWAEKSGHLIELEQPERVIEALQDVLAQVRSPSDSAGNKP
jgi:pimeloyl-ACP methyl ester carboxylesterase